jgi:hypothetical protein
VQIEWKFTLEACWISSILGSPCWLQPQHNDKISKNSQELTLMVHQQSYLQLLTL